MAENLVIEAPDFAEIEKKAGRASRDAINLLWSVLNQEIITRRKTVRDAKDTLETKISNAAPTVQQDNFNTERSTVYFFTGASNFSLTGIRNGIEGAILFIHNIGAATITLVNNSGASDAANRLILSTGANKALITDTSTCLLYINGRWREFKGL